MTSSPGRQEHLRYPLENASLKASHMLSAKRFASHLVIAMPLYSLPSDVALYFLCQPRYCFAMTSPSQRAPTQSISVSSCQHPHPSAAPNMPIHLTHTRPCPSKKKTGPGSTYVEYGRYAPRLCVMFGLGVSSSQLLTPSWSSLSSGGGLSTM